MKIVRLKNNIVYEIIPDYALPVEKWYGSEFAKLCVEASDDVQYGWIYDETTKEFKKPEPFEPEPFKPEPTQLDVIEAQVVYTAMMTDTLLEG